MRITNIIILFFFIINCNAQINNLDQIRKTYLESAKSEENIHKLISTCEDYKSKNNSIICALQFIIKKNNMIIFVILIFVLNDILS